MLSVLVLLALAGQFLCLRCLNKVFQTRQFVLPEGTVAAQPKVDSFQWAGIELEQSLSPQTVHSHQPSAPEHAQMLRNSRPRNRECLSDLACRQPTSK